MRTLRYRVMCPYSRGHPVLNPSPHLHFLLAIFLHPFVLQNIEKSPETRTMRYMVLGPSSKSYPE
jgi:hypothetical protein